MDLINDRLFESFNIKANNNIVSININATKLIQIDEVTQNKEDFIKALEFVLMHDAELVPHLLNKAINEANNLCRKNRNTSYKLKMLHPFYDKYQLDETKKLDATTFDENDISDLKFDKVLPKMYVAVVAYENNKFWV